MIDSDGYRPNVGIIISNGKGQLMWAKRYGQNSWQFPQGGINPGETAEQAMYRELYEEVGLKERDVKILAVSRVWLKYKLPKRMVRWESKPLCIGQKQRWFLLELISNDDSIDMLGNFKPEFDGFRWVSMWYPIRQVVSFKRDVYRRALKEFAPVVLNQQQLHIDDNVYVTKIFSKKNQNQSQVLQKQVSELASVRTEENSVMQLPHPKQTSPDVLRQKTSIETTEKINSNDKNEQLNSAETHSIEKRTKKPSHKKRKWPKRIKANKK